MLEGKWLAIIFVSNESGADRGLFQVAGFLKKKGFGRNRIFGHDHTPQTQFLLLYRLILCIGARFVRELPSKGLGLSRLCPIVSQRP